MTPGRLQTGVKAIGRGNGDFRDRPAGSKCRCGRFLDACKKEKQPCGRVLWNRSVKFGEGRVMFTVQMRENLTGAVFLPPIFRPYGSYSGEPNMNRNMNREIAASLRFNLGK